MLAVIIVAASDRIRVDRLLATHADRGAGTGPAVSAAIRSGVPISATSSLTRLVPADPYRLAAAILP